MKQKLAVISILVSTLSFGQGALHFLDRAKTQVEAGNLEEALLILDEGLEVYSNDHDLMAYGARVLLWKKAFTEATSKIEELLLHYPNDYEGLELKSTTFLWQEEWEGLKKACKEALKTYKEDPLFQERFLIALNELEQHREVRKAYATIEDKNERIQAINFDSRLSQHQRIGASYRYSHFTNGFSPWQITRINYHREGKHPWSIAGIYGNMFDMGGTMVKSSVYPRINQYFSGYVSVSYSNATIFPTYRVGGELIGRIKKVELSGGARWMNFSETKVDLLIYTAGVGLYFGNYFVNYKAYLTDFQGEADNLTHTLLLRRILDHRYHYIQLNLSEGTTPLQVNNLSEVSRLQAMSAQLIYSNIILDDYLITIGIGSQIEKYNSGDRNRLDGSVSFARIF